MYNLVDNDLKTGIIKPLNSSVFDADKIEDAFRFMSGGQHIGKVLVKVRKENDSYSLPFVALNRIYYQPIECIVITGGLGGFGMELVEWLMSRGCQKFVVSSRRGINNSNQHLRVEWVVKKLSRM